MEETGSAVADQAGNRKQSSWSVVGRGLEYLSEGTGLMCGIPAQTIGPTSLCAWTCC